MAALAGVIGCGSDAKREPTSDVPPGWTPAGRINELADDVWTSRRVRLYPEHAPDLVYTIFLRRDGAGSDQVVALSDRCPHQGCPLRFVGASRKFICPCHGAVMSFDGEPLGGPVTRAMDSFATQVTDGVVYIGPRIEALEPGVRTVE